MILHKALLLFAFLIVLNSCSQDESVPTSQTTSEKAELTFVRTQIDNRAKNKDNSSARIVNGYFYGLTPSGYQYAYSANGYQVNVTARYLVDNSTDHSAKTFKLSGSSALILSGTPTSTNGSVWIYDPIKEDNNSLIWTVPANAVSCELNFTLKLKSPYSSVEGFFTLQKTGVSENHTDDYIYIIQGN